MADDAVRRTSELRCEMRQVPLPRGWKTRARKMCQDIASAHQDGEMIGEPFSSFLLELLDRHPCAGEKRGPGVRGVSVITEHTYGTRYFILLRTDGSATDFSWRACITPPVHEDDCKKAMRAAISQQVIRFRHAQFSSSSSQSCALCGTALSRLAEIDHASPSFEELAQSYATALGGWDSVKLEPSADGQIGRTLSPGDAYTWTVFHQSKAVLQLLCGACNRKKR